MSDGLGGLQINQAVYDALPDDEKAEVDKALAQIAEAVEANPLLTFKPHPKQAAFLAAKQRYKVLFGGNRSGKTECAIANDVIQCIDEAAVPDHLKAFKKLTPPVKGRIVTPKFAHHEETTFNKLRALIPKDQLFGGNWEKAFSKSKRVLSFANGSTIQFLTFDQDVDAHASVDLDFTHFDEEPEGHHGENLFRENRARLIDRGGDFYYSMTPLLGMTWTYDVFGLPWEEKHDPETDIFEDKRQFVVRIDMDDNPHLSQEAKEEYLASLSNEERRASKEGRFVHFGGMIYPEWDDDTNLVDDLELDHIGQLDHFVSIDPGINTTAVVFCGFDRDNAAWIYDELYLHDQDAIPENAAAVIRSRLAEWGVEKVTYLIDPSARNRASVNADNVQAAYYRAGILALPAQNAVEAGILEVKRRLQSEPPKLFVSRRCEQWRWERKRYRRKPNENNQSAFDVVKRDDHLMDACLIPGTMVETEAGAKPIEHVRVGERVWTRDGLREVQFSEMTNPDAAVRTIVTDDGREVTATDNHPFWVEGKGWTRADAVRYGDILVTWPKLSHTRESAGVDTPTQRDEATVCITGPRATATSTVASTKTTSAPSPRAITSTTSTVIPTTTTRRISPLSVPSSTSANTGRQNEVARQPNTLRRCVRWLRNGIARKRGVSGTENTVPPSTRRSPQPANWSASSVANPLSLPPSSVAAFDSAPTTVSPSGADLPASMTRIAPAPSAATPSASTNTPRPRLARVSVVLNRSAGQSAVYDLTVAGSHEFFADGVLVHNTRYVCMARPIKPHSHNPAKPKRYAYNPHYQQPYSEEPRFQEAPPMGPLS